MQLIVITQSLVLGLCRFVHTMSQDIQEMLFHEQTHKYAFRQSLSYPIIKAYAIINGQSLPLQAPSLKELFSQDNGFANHELRMRLLYYMPK
jgi:hypothetical protein